MYDPFGSMGSFMRQFSGFMQNPIQFLMQRRMNIPQQYANDPRGAIQYLMNSGQMTQEQFTQLQNVARQIQSNPQFAQMMQRR